jgi:uncharacterized damage-inducible protein DinB
MPDSPDHLVIRLSTEAQKTVEFFNALAPGQWERTVYTEGSCWTVHQVLAHFVATEKAFRQLIENVLAGGSGAPEEFNIDSYNERKVASLRDFSPDELMQQFEAQRQANIELVKRMGPQDLLKTGRHPFLGMTTLEEIIQLLYRHNQIHQRDMRRLPQAGEEPASQSG